MRSILAISCCLLLTVGCASVDDSGPASQHDDVTAAAVPVDGTPAAAGVVALLADPATTLDVLRAAGVDSRAAGLVLGHRDGLDGIPGTGDEDPIGSIAELDRIPYVGASTLAKLASYAAAHGFVPAGDELVGTFDGVSFTADEARATLALVNDADATRLEGYGVSSRAAMTLGSAPHLDSLLELSEIPYVGTATLEILKAKAVELD